MTPEADPTALAGGSPLTNRVGYLGIKFGELVERQADAALKPLGLTPRAFNVLCCIAAGNQLSQQDLSTMLGVHAPALALLSDQLERNGLIGRTRSEVDRRRYILSLTAAGEKVWRSALDEMEKTEDYILSPLTANERKTFYDYLKAVLHPHWSV